MGLNLEDKRLAYFMPLIFLLMATLLRYMALAQSPYPNGWDGYYYVMQVHSWLSYGYLQSADFSLVYPYFIAFSYLLGDYVLAYQLGTAFLSGLLASTGYWLVYHTTGKGTMALLAGSFLVFSPTLTYMASQFPKNMLGLVFLTLALNTIKEKKYFWFLGFAILAFISHRMTAGFCLLIGGAYLFRQLSWRWWLAIVTLLGLVTLLPGIFHYSDLQRFEGQLSWQPHFAPYAFYQLFHRTMTGWWSIEIILLVLALGVLCYYYWSDKEWRSDNDLHQWCWPCLLAIALFPFFEMAFGSMGYRFFLTFPIFLSLYFTTKISGRRHWVVPLAICFLASSFWAHQAYQPAHHDPPNKRYTVIVERLEGVFNREDYPLIIAHKGLAEMIIFKTDFDALNWAPDAHVSAKNVLRVVHNLDLPHFSKYLNKKEMKALKKLTLHYYAVPESLWRQYLQSVKATDDQGILTRIAAGDNPMVLRPAFLKKGKSL